MIKMPDTPTQVIAGISFIILTSIFAWMMSMGDRIKEIEHHIVGKEYVLEKFNGAERRIIRLENEVFLIVKERDGRK